MHRLLRSLLLLLLVLPLAATSLTGCAVFDHARPDEPRLYDFPGPIAVNVQSFNGDVVIEVDEDAETTMVQVVRDSIHPLALRDEARQSMQHINWSADVINTETGQQLQVITSTTYDQPHLQRAHVYITAPAVDGVSVATTNGKVHARMIEGPIDIRTHGGDVRVMTMLPLTEPVTIINNGGDVNYRVRAESTGTFECVAVNGSVYMRAPKGEIDIEPNSTASELYVTLNRGENPVTLRSVDGDIRIAVVPDPLAVGQYIVEP